MMVIPETVTPESIEPYKTHVRVKSTEGREDKRKNNAYNRDTVSTDASVALEDNVGALVNRKTVVLVVDSAI